MFWLCCYLGVPTSDTTGEPKHKSTYDDSLEGCGCAGRHQLDCLVWRSLELVVVKWYG